MQGKENCELLKKLRKQIADANGIEYEPAVCTYEGDCLGYCPKCDEELRYLEEQLRAKQRRGEAVSVTDLELDRYMREKILFRNRIKVVECKEQDDPRKYRTMGVYRRSDMIEPDRPEDEGYTDIRLEENPERLFSMDIAEGISDPRDMIEPDRPEEEPVLMGELMTSHEINEEDEYPEMGILVRPDEMIDPDGSEGDK